MDKKWYETSEFLALRKKWYDKLAKAGFEDIEYIDWRTGESGNLLKGFGHMDAVKHYTPEHERYYELARQHLWRLRNRRKAALQRRKKGGKGKEPLPQKYIEAWKLHSEGYGMSHIMRELGITRYKLKKFLRQEIENMLRREFEGG